MATLRQQLKAAKKKVKGQVLDKMEEASFIIAEALVDSAKVDTGLHAANFLPAVDSVRKDDLTFEDFNIEVSKLHYPNDRQISVEAAKKIAMEIPKFKVGDEIVWSNSVPYVNDIDGLTTILEGALLGIARANKEL